MLARKQIASSAEPDAVEGLYLYKTFPPLSADATSALAPNQEINRYGSAWWSGTSFATPIASGLAAHYILDGKRGQAVINAILTDLIKANALYEPRLQAPVLEVQELRDGR
jgi:subtilisin family serine protease